jgi:hypothetical protein
VRNQEDIICQVHGMGFRELLDLVIKQPFFLTDNYFVAVREAVRIRYSELIGNARSYRSF